MSNDDEKKKANGYDLGDLLAGAFIAVTAAVVVVEVVAEHRDRRAQREREREHTARVPSAVPPIEVEDASNAGDADDDVPRVGAGIN